MKTENNFERIVNDSENAHEEKPSRDGSSPIYDRDAKTLVYGLYPQTHVSDEKLVSELEKLSPSANVWSLYEGRYYAKCIAKPNNDGFACLEFDDGSSIVNGQAYWFRCDPIEWRVLSITDGICLVVSRYLLDAHRYHKRSNGYSKSEIRKWLNGDFLNAAFPPNDSFVQTTEVDNSERTTCENCNEYACEDTKDKVFLLSCKDYKSADYFADDASRKCKTTDWARANGASYGAGLDPFTGLYWTRSPNSYDSEAAWCVDGNGAVNNDPDYGCVAFLEISVRPSLRIKLPQND